MAHTKGKWEIVEGVNNRGREWVIYEPYLGTICKVDDSLSECQENSRLISAAPDLLEACKGALKVLKDCQANENGDDAWDMPWPVIDNLELAIAKAESR